MREDEVSRSTGGLHAGCFALPKRTASLIIDSGNDYLIGLKENQPTLYKPFFNKLSYGLGVMIDPESDQGEKIGHGGDGPGYNTWVMHLPNFKGRKLTLAVFCNTSMGSHPFHLINDLLCVLSNT